MMIRCPTCQAPNASGVMFCAECGTRLQSVAPEVVPSGPATGMIPQQTLLQDRYVILQKLGQGGMGAVYRAGDRRLSTVTWAVKEMSQSAITGPLDLQRARDSFRHEAEMLAALAHPNLPRVIDHFEQDGKAYLVMEYIPGETLLSALQREGLPPAPRVLDWARQLCDVLDYLHSQSPPIIFRDLKPANIMVTPQGQIKLIDFGIARLFKPGKAHDTQAYGTVGYSAPEQYGRGQTDARADVYALGVLLHQLLTGYDPTSTPFRLPPAIAINPTLPPQLSAAISTATDSDPDRRFPSMRAFRDALLGAADDRLLRAAATPSAALHADGARYARPGSQPFALAGVATSGPNTRTTRLANASRWVGIGGVALMGLATLIMLLTFAQGDVRGATAGLAYFIAFPALALGPIALILGVIALTRAETRQTSDGRFHATMGVATGVATLLLCCVIGAIVGSAS